MASAMTRPLGSLTTPRNILRHHYQALRTVRLEALERRLAAEESDAPLDAVRDWSDMLSLGEQQRLTFARLLISRPKLAILDEVCCRICECHVFAFASARDLPRTRTRMGALKCDSGLCSLPTPCACYVD